MTTTDLSVAVPVFNEEKVLGTFCATLVPVLDSLNLSYEIILVDDGSTDATWQIITSICAANKNIRAIHFARNFGQQVALSAGIQAAYGRAVITMDADLQHPPREIPRMVAAWQKGASIVSMVRDETKEISFVK
ncbi:MAG: glycosyltransferase family 2 protein, partial [Bacteroidales bacterium]|nr:glycosyltransferase family 2 protein [Bacteroidales bacterium]